MSLGAHKQPLRIGVLISGGGTTLRNLLQKIDRQELTARVAVVISSNALAKGIQIAHDAGVMATVLDPKSFSSPEAYRDATFQGFRDAGVELVVMAGFLRHLLIPDDFQNKVTNIHPALIPAFCGKGYYGSRVHQAVLRYGAKITGCTVHFVDNQYDHGPIIAQRVVPVLDEDSPESLAERVFREECELYPQVIQWYADGRLHVEGRRVFVRPPVEDD